MRASSALGWQQLSFHSQVGGQSEPRDVAVRASKIFYLATAIFAAFLALGSCFVASQSLIGMGGVFLGAQLVGRLIGRVSHFHTDPKIASVDKVESLIKRRMWESLILMGAYLGLCGAAAWSGIVLLKSATLINTPILLQSASYGIGSLGFLKRAHVNGINCSDAKAADQYQRALFPIYAIIDMASREEKKSFANLRQRVNQIVTWARTGPDGRRHLEVRLSQLQKSLEIAKSNEEEIPAKLVDALITIYLLDGGITKQLEVAAKILEKNPDLVAEDLSKHCLSLVGNNDHVIRKFHLDIWTLSTYLSDAQFESYFQLKKMDSVLSQISRWQQQESEGNWGQLEEEIVLNSREIQGALEQFLERTMQFPEEQELHLERMERLGQYRDRIRNEMTLIESIYPMNASCIDLCEAMTEDQFISYFLLDGSFTIVEEILRDPNQGFSRTLAKLNLDVSENDIAWALDDILLRFIVRTQTLPHPTQVVEMSDANGRLITLCESSRKVQELREELLKKFPILTDSDALLAKCSRALTSFKGGVRSHQSSEIGGEGESVEAIWSTRVDTCGFIPSLDLEINRMTALRLSFLLDESNGDKGKLPMLEKLYDKAMRRIGQIFRN